MQEPSVYLSGQFVPASEARISIYDYGIILGATITDQLRTFRHKLFRLEDHIQRFYESAKYARMDPPIGFEETAEVTREIVRRNARLISSEDDLAVVYFMTPGENLTYAGTAARGEPLQPTYCIHTFPLPFALFASLFTEGLHLVTPSTRHVPPQCVDQKIKNRSRLHWWLAEREARLVDPKAVPLLLDLDGNLTEVSGANVLLAKDGVVYSPTARNILRGTSRKVISELCGKLGIAFQERDLQPHDAITADEVFVATTPYCMAPVTRVTGITIGSGEVGGPIFEQLLAAWSAEVGVDIRNQILANAAAEKEAV